MGRNSNINEDSLKAGWLAKKSQLTSIFPAFATSYKEKWFVLTRTALIYFDSQNPARRKEKGRLTLKDIKLVEKLNLKDREGALQIGYVQENRDLSICIIAKSDVERDEWMALIRNLVRTNANLADKYHPRQYSAGRWSCCGDTSRAKKGCEPITWTPRYVLLKLIIVGKPKKINLKKRVNVADIDIVICRSTFV